MLQAFIKNEIEKMLEIHDTQVAQSMTKEMFENMDKYPTKPLVRIKIEYSGGFSTLNVKRFGAEFEGKIANPDDFLKFYKMQKQSQAHNKKMRTDEGFDRKIKISGGQPSAPMQEQFFDYFA